MADLKQPADVERSLSEQLTQDLDGLYDRPTIKKIIAGAVMAVIALVSSAAHADGMKVAANTKGDDVPGLNLDKLLKDAESDAQRAEAQAAKSKRRAEAAKRINQAIAEATKTK